MQDIYALITKYYHDNQPLHQLLLQHSEQVRDKALEVVQKHHELQADAQFIAEAALLHDIGIYLCDAPTIYCYGKYPYIAHGYLGADILRKEGWERHAWVCERHTGTGLSLATIVEKALPLPHRDMRPVSIEEEIIAYADKFFSKSNPDKMNDLVNIRETIGRYGAENLVYFDDWHRRFS